MSKLILGYPQTFAQLQGEHGYPLGVAFGLFISQVKGARPTFDGIVIGFYQPPVGLLLLFEQLEVVNGDCGLTGEHLEEGLDTILTLLEKAKDHQDVLYIPFMALMELEYLLLRKISPEDPMAILTLVRAWPVQVPESTEEWRHQAAVIKSQTPLSVADAWIASLAQVQHAELVHKDPEFEQVIELQMLKLSYKA